MENWDDLKFLLAVHKSGTMVSAARQLGTNAATVSRRLERLANTLGAQPFIKSSGEWNLNPAIGDLLNLIEDFDARLNTQANKLALSSASARTVKLRIGAPPIVLGPLLGAQTGHFYAQHPEYRLELHNRVGSEGLGDVDVMLMDVPPTRGRLITKRVGQYGFKVYSYDDSPRDGAWIGVLEELDSFEPMRRARGIFQTAPIMRASNFHDAQVIAKSSRLPVLLPKILADQDPDLRPFDNAEDPAIVSFWIAYHNSRKTDMAVNSTVSWITACFVNMRDRLCYG